MAERMFNVLFLCTGNSARSIMAESLLRKTGAGRFHAFSAGSHPKGAVNPFAIKVLESYGLRPTACARRAGTNLRRPARRRWISSSRFATPPPPKTCPVWPGQPMTAHWGIEDPAAVEGTDIQKEAAFVLATQYLRNRISDLRQLADHEASTRCR